MRSFSNCKVAAILAHDLKCIYLLTITFLQCIITDTFISLGWGCDFPKIDIRGGVQTIL